MLRFCSLALDIHTQTIGSPVSLQWFSHHITLVCKAGTRKFCICDVSKHWSKSWYFCVIFFVDGQNVRPAVFPSLTRPQRCPWKGLDTTAIHFQLVFLIGENQVWMKIVTRAGPPWEGCRTPLVEPDRQQSRLGGTAIQRTECSTGMLSCSLSIGLWKVTSNKSFQAAKCSQ